MTYWTDLTRPASSGERGHPMAKVHVILALIALISIAALIVQGGHLGA